MGEAVLAVWDGEETLDLTVEWSNGPDVDARVRLPRRLSALWGTARRVVEEEAREAGGVPTAPSYPLSRTTPSRSVWGIFATARVAFGLGARWRVHPPSPEVDRAELPPGAVQ